MFLASVRISCGDTGHHNRPTAITESKRFVIVRLNFPVRYRHVLCGFRNSIRLIKQILRCKVGNLVNENQSSAHFPL